MCVGSHALSGACSVCCVLIDACSIHVVAVEKINDDLNFKSLLVWMVFNVLVLHEARPQCERAGADKIFEEMCCEVGWGARVCDPAVFVVCQLHAGLWPAQLPVYRSLTGCQPSLQSLLAEPLTLMTDGCKSCACKDASMPLPRPLMNHA